MNISWGGSDNGALLSSFGHMSKTLSLTRYEGMNGCVFFFGQVNIVFFEIPFFSRNLLILEEYVSG